MTVYASKPEINVREKLKELDKPSGIAGEAMLRAETPQEQFNLIGAGRKNLIINGGFDVWQRGTSATYTSLTKKYTADRFASYWDNTTVSKSTLTIDSCKYNALRCNYTGSSYQAYIDYAGEDPYILSGKQVTFSMYVQGTAGRTYRTRMRVKINGTFVDTPFSQETVLDGTVQKIEVTATCADYTGYTRTSSDYFLLELYTTDTAPADFTFTLVQLELGKVATPFEHRSYGEELALCQRYGVRLGAHPDDPTTHYNLIGSGWWRASTVAYNLQIQAKPPVTLRHKDYSVYVIGTNQFYVQSGGTVGQASFFAVNNSGSSPDAIWLDFTATTAAATDGQAAIVASENSPAYNNAIFIDAEL